MRIDWRGALGAVLLGASVATAAWAASDPFEDARYYVAIDDAKVLALVDSGQVSVRDTNPEGYSLLHYAADANRLALVRALVQRGADPGLRARSGSTPRDMATSALVKAALRPAAALDGGNPARTTGRAAPPASKPPASNGADSNRMACNQRWKADYDLCSDTTCKMVTYRKHAQCLKTGRYW